MNKKKYIKPGASFQNLRISSHIASGCSKARTFAEYDCPVEIPGWGGITVFMDPSLCDYSTPESSDMICYHVPTADGNVFTS